MSIKRYLKAPLILVCSLLLVNVSGNTTPSSNIDNSITSPQDTVFHKPTKTTVIQKNNTISFSNSDTLSICEAISDTINFGDTTLASIEEGSEKIKAASYLYMYLPWMAGYEKYDNFDILSIHYKHQTVIKADTISLGEFVVPMKGRISSNYGQWRRGGRRHGGIDIPSPVGTPIVAAFDGIVRMSQDGYNGGYGNLVVVRHENHLETYYAHLSRRLVNPGQVIKAGDTIALCGNTGRSYGAHLHFETRFLGMKFNPHKIIDFEKGELKTDSLYIDEKNVKTPLTQKELLALKSGDKNGTATSSGAIYYRVRSGDTLGHIAAKYRTYVSSIKRLNGLRSDFIREGQRLRVR